MFSLAQRSQPCVACYLISENLCSYVLSGFTSCLRHENNSRPCCSFLKVKSESEVIQSCLILCDTTDCSPPGSSIHGISQTRILEWVAFPSPGHLPDPGIKPGSPALQADSLLSEPQWKLLDHCLVPSCPGVKAL